MQMIKILLVDDEPSVIKGLNLLVDWAEYNCSIIGSAGNGEIALRKIKELEPDLIIIDINMPIMTGLELLKALKDEEINIKTIILSGHDDFEYLKQGLLFNVENYLLKPVDKEELIKTITLIYHKIEQERLLKVKSVAQDNVITNNILNNLVKNTITTTEYNERAKLINLPNLNKDLFVSALILSDSFSDDLQNIFNLNKFSILKDIRQHLNPDKELIFLSTDNVISIVHICTDKQKIINKLDQIAVTVKDRYRMNFQMVLSNKVTTHRELSTGYQQVIKVMQYSYFFKQDIVLEYDKFISRLNQLSHFDYDFSDTVTSIKNLDYEQFIKIIDGYYLDYSTKKISISALRFMIAESMILLNKQISKRQESQRGFSGRIELMFQEIITTQPKKSKIQFYKLCEEIFCHMKSSESYNYSTPIQKIIDVINNEYSNDLSLSIIAERIHFHANYVGKLFKQETGEFFSDYLNNVRIEKAKEYLDNTNLKSTEVASLIGIRNTNYFYKVFKKVVGITPTEYKDGKQSST